MGECSPRSTAPEADSCAAAQPTHLALNWCLPNRGRLVMSGHDRFSVGRADDAAWRIPSSEASREHAELIRDGPLWIIRDLGSRNGTFLNGERIDRAPLGPASVIRAGGSVAVVTEEPQDHAELRSFAEVGPGFFGGSALRGLLASAERTARSDLPVVLEGETGSGKERVAQWIHATSGRSGPLIAINCAALPEALAEAELFGYRRGAFTGAVQNSLGYFRAAQAGTLFLDEILDLAPALQAKLLRAIEQHAVTPLGESAPLPVDVRLIVATQAPLQSAVDAGIFRGDLLARLDGATLRVLPLRERKEDIGSLFMALFSQRCGGHPPVVDARFIEALCLYEWPYNVRELDFLARRMAVAHGHVPTLRRSHLPPRMMHAFDPFQDAAAASGDEYDRFIASLRAHGGVVARAAQAAGISRMRAYRLMKEHDFDLNAARNAEEGTA
jgi:DNA-binding NtrC family response regulator